MVTISFTRDEVISISESILFNPAIKQLSEFRKVHFLRILDKIHKSVLTGLKSLIKDFIVSFFNDNNMTFRRGMPSFLKPKTKRAGEK